MHGVARFLAAAGLVAVAMALEVPVALADSCIDLRTGQNYDCAGEPPPPPAKKAAAPANNHALRDALRKRLQEGSPNAAGDAAATAHQRQVADAVSAALAACNAGNMGVYRSKLAAAANAAGSESERDMVAQARATCDRTVAERKAKADKQEANAKPEAAPKEPFSVCGSADRYGVRTCFEMMRSGEACNKTLQQNGDTVWQIERLPVCDSDLLARRDAYFAGAKPPAGKPEIASPNAEVVAALREMSPACMDQLRAFLQSARDGAQSDAASVKALGDFRDLEKQCGDGMRRLVDALGLAMPTRKMADADRNRMSRALAGTSIASAPPPPPSPPSEDGDGSGSFDAEEVVDFGVQALGALSDILGAFSGGYSGPVVRGGRANTGAPAYVPRQRNQSTITGGRSN